jgi:hypothetical protein
MRIQCIILCFLVSVSGYCQTDTTKVKKKQFPSISANYSYGDIIQTTDFVRGDNLMGTPIEHFQAYSIKALWQNPGYTDWQKIYRSPYYGVGLSIGDFFNPEEIGHPVSVYGVLGIPIKRWHKLELYSEFQFGVAANWEHYDSISNPKNLVIGGGLTVHLNIGLNAFYPVTKNLDLGAGMSFVHFSNGGFERPNQGFNIYTPSVELKYHLFDRPNIKEIERPGRLGRSNDLFFMLGYGDHQLNEHELDTNYFAIAGVSAIYYTQLANAFRLGYGTDLNYWMGLTALPDGRMGQRDFRNLTVGLVLEPEFIVDRLTLVSGFGIYAIHLNYGNFKQTYQRLGVRYEFYRNLSVGVNVRAINFMLAEFLEFNLGYRIRWMK